MGATALLQRLACPSCRTRILFQARRKRWPAGPVLSQEAIPSGAARQSTSATAGGPGRSKRTLLPDKPARTRFAPSPTGYLHLGSLRTALYNYLLARATNGQFLLRLEDTDQSRLVPDAESRLYEDLKWAGLSWDEGPDRGGPFGPYKQSDRLEIYRPYAERLLQEGKAFRCFCSHEDMEAHHHRSLASEGTFGLYPGRCLSISDEESAARASNGEAHTIRFKSSPYPVPVRDIIYGLYKKKLPEDHFIIMKTDGFPTYHFANVVDDHLMDITHVVRGAEWLISTAKHVSLYEAFGWKPPQFAHVGLLVDTNRQKLSKRNMDTGIDSYRKAGILPPALLNFAALLGWNPGSSSANKGVMTLDEMVQTFTPKFTKGDIVVNIEKLDFFQKKHMHRVIHGPSSDTSLVDEYLTVPMLQRVREIEAQKQAFSLGPDPDHGPSTKTAVPTAIQLSELGPLISGLHIEETADTNTARQRLHDILRISRSDAVTPALAVDANQFLIWQPSVQKIRDSFAELGPEAAADSVLLAGHPAGPAEILQVLISSLEEKVEASHWTADSLRPVLDQFIKGVSFPPEQNSTASPGYKYLRWALLGLDNGPQAVPLLEFLGKSETLRRLQTALAVAQYTHDTTRACP